MTCDIRGCKGPEEYSAFLDEGEKMFTVVRFCSKHAKLRTSEWEELER